MENVNNVIDWYQKKIGTYDKQLWEKCVEQQVIQGIQCIENVPKKATKVKSELIDVDLVRGSSFPKAKPQFSWIIVARMGLLRVLMLPFYFRWWREQTSTKFVLLLLVIYCLQISTISVFIFSDEKSQSVTTTDVITPVLLMLFMSILHAQIVSTHFNRLHAFNSRSPATIGSKSKSRKSRQNSDDHDESQELNSNKYSIKNKLNAKDKRIGRFVKSSRRSSLDNGSVKLSRSRHRNSGPRVTIQEVRAVSLPCLVGSKIHHEIQLKTSPKVLFLPPDGKDKPGSSLNDAEDSSQYVGESEHEEEFTTWSKDNLKQKYTPFNQGDDDDVCENFDEQTDLVDQPITETVGEIICSESDRFPLGNGQSLSVHDDDRFDHTAKRSSNDDADADDDDDGEDEDEDDDAVIDVIDVKEQSNNVCDIRINDTNCHSDHQSDISSEAKHDSSIEADQLKIIQPHHNNDQNVPEITMASSLSNIDNDDVNTLPPSVSSTDIDFTDSKVDSSSSRRRFHTVQNVRRRRRSKANVCSSGDVGKRKSDSLLNQAKKLKGSHSSCESDVDSAKNNPASFRNYTTVVKRRKLVDSSSDDPMSENEWERMNSEIATSDTSSCTSGSELSDDHETSSHDDPFGTWEHHNSKGKLSGTVIHNSHTQAHDRVSCYIWESEDCKKVDLTVLDIGWTIIHRVDKIPETADYLILGTVMSIFMAFIPIIFHCYVNRGLLEYDKNVGFFDSVKVALVEVDFRLLVLIINGIFLRLSLCSIFFFLLSVAERTFKQRLLYAKHFCYLTSSRRARKYELPHFRLNKVRNIKTWLSLRSYLKKRGPQRSVDVIVSASFLLAVTLVALMCVQLLKETEAFLDELYNWELVVWCLSLATYLLRFMTLGTKINKKYRNLSVLITEQINLYLHMEQKPHKKEELMLANNVLKLAEDLLKELESPFKISGLSANPFLYNVTKVIILSAFSAVLTELLGFKLKLYKIKIKA